MSWSERELLKVLRNMTPRQRLAVTRELLILLRRAELKNVRNIDVIDQSDSSEQVED